MRKDVCGRRTKESNASMQILREINLRERTPSKALRWDKQPRTDEAEIHGKPG